MKVKTARIVGTNLVQGRCLKPLYTRRAWCAKLMPRNRNNSGQFVVTRGELVVLRAHLPNLASAHAVQHGESLNDRPTCFGGEILILPES